MPSGSRGAVAATVGLPHTQRAAMPTTPRAGRPSCSRRTARSASLTGGNGGVVTAQGYRGAGTRLDRRRSGRLGAGRCRVGVGRPARRRRRLHRLREPRRGDRAHELRHPVGAASARRSSLTGACSCGASSGGQVVVDEVDDLARPDVVQPLARLGRDVGGIGPALALRLEVGDLLAADLDRAPRARRSAVAGRRRCRSSARARRPRARRAPA